MLHLINFLIQMDKLKGILEWMRISPPHIFRFLHAELHPSNSENRMLIRKRKLAVGQSSKSAAFERGKLLKRKNG
jgi:hypothetical protein